MMTSAAMNTARAEAARALAARADAGNPLRLWLRDDDAVRPTPALDRLLGMTADAGVPLTLAVIPAPWDQSPTGPDLAALLRDRDDVTAAVHGWSHRNTAPEGVKKQELGPHRPIAEMRAELRAGLMRLATLHGTRALPLLVPPWNRIAPALTETLAGDGFAAISTFGEERPVQGLQVVNTHLDIIDWHGTRGGRDPGAMWAELAALATQGRPFAGVLTHHLVHDAAAWDFLRDLFEVTSIAGGVWCSVKSLYGQ